jgi:hypothetical protein
MYNIKRIYQVGINLDLKNFSGEEEDDNQYKTRLCKLTGKRPIA